MPVKDYMNKEIISGDKDLTVQEAVKIMVEKESSYIIVLDKGKPVGIVTEDDLIKKVLAADRDPKNTRLYEIMSTPLKTIDPDAPLSEAAEIMGQMGIRKIPVIRDGILYGVITSREIAKYFNAYINKVVKDILKFRTTIF